MYLLRTIALLCLFMSAPAWSEPIRMSAKTGKFDARTLSAPAAAVSFTGTAKLLAFASSPQWPAASYIGIHEGADRNNSVQVLAIRNRPTDDYLVVGYRVVADGKELQVKSITSIPLNAAWNVRIRFVNGVAHLQVNEERAVEVRTPFKRVSPYVSVSSGEAEFTIDL